MPFNVKENLGKFLEDSKRIFIVSKKPTWDEYKRMVLIVSIGIGLIGLVGYIVYLIFALASM